MGLFSKNTSLIDRAPTEETFAIVNSLYFNKSLNLTTIGLSAVILDLIKKGYISCEIGDNDHLKLSKKSKSLSSDDLEKIAKISFRITKKQNLKVSDKIAIDLLKNITNSKKFNLKQLYQRIIRPNVARAFVLNFEKWSKFILNENDCSKLIIEDKFTNEYKEHLNEWKGFKKYLKSNKDFKEDFLKDIDDNLIYSFCFDVEDKLIKNLKNSNLDSNSKINTKANLDSKLFDFIECGGSTALVIIFNAGFANNTEKDDGSGTFYGANNKGFVPGF